MYKIAIIGGGVVGGLIARAMSKYKGSLVILEKESDVAMGQSKANSGIVHAGYDPQPGSLKAILNVRGSQMMEEVCRELDVKYRNNGTLVVGFDDDDMIMLKELLERGRQNGVEGLELIDGEAVRRIEKNLSEKIVGALYAPTGAVVCPYELTIHSIGNAMDNGAELITEFEVAGIERKYAPEPDTGACYKLTSADGRTIEAEYVVNCAGIHSDEIARMVGSREFSITPRRGQYLLLDKEAGNMVSTTVFRTPTKMGKGVLATKTVDGNILLGPTSEDIEDKEDKAVTSEGLLSVLARETEFFDSSPLNLVITQFTGLRAHGNMGDFFIESPQQGFINCAGIESPGLYASPAIAEMVEKMLIEAGAGEFYGLKDYAFAHAKVFGDNTVGAPGRIMDFLTNNRNSEAVLLAERFDPLNEEYSELSHERYHKGPLRHLLGKDFSFIGYGMGEHMIHYVTMYAILNNVKVKVDGKDTSLYNAFYV